MAVRTIVPCSFYMGSPEVVARGLLGKLVVNRVHNERLVGRIVEVEAYLGFNDPAAHTFIGKTARNAVLFGPPGFAYVYFIYGMHYCLNFSCEPDGQPGGVLIRALKPMEGLETMARLRGFAWPANVKKLAAGPGMLCEAMGITRALHNGLDVTSKMSPLRVMDDGMVPEVIEATPRIGIRKAVDEPLRFLAREFIAAKKR